MYDVSIVGQRIELAQEQLGFPLEYHKVSEVEDFQKGLERKYEDAYERARAAASGSAFPERTFQARMSEELSDHLAPKLSPDEVRFMQNEKFLSMCDAAYWMTRYYWIKNDRNELQRFSFRPAQKVYFDIISYLESRGLAIEVLINKARQLGMSTATEGLIAHRAMLSYGVNATIASFDQSKTLEMAKMLFLAYDMTPWWMRPVDTRRVESDRGQFMFGSQRSGVLFQHGNQASGISQGTTPTVYHLSEVAYYPDAQSLIEIGLFKAVHPSNKVLGVLESTADGDTGWWHDTYWYSKRKWPKSRMVALFLPWFLGTDKYPNDTYLLKNPLPAKWRPETETYDMIARAELYVRSSPALAKVLGDKWKLPREQAWWWENLFLEARDKGKEKDHFQEYPTDDYESFQGSYESVFGRQVIEVVDNQRERGYDAYGIVGQSIEDKNEPLPEDIDYDKPRIPIRHVHPGKGEVYHWELVPLRWKEDWEKLSDIREVEIPNGMAMIFHHPEEGWEYSFGVDTSNGIGDEATVIAGSRLGKSDGDADTQVCEFRSNMVSHVEAYPYVMALAAYYSQYMPETTRNRQALVTIEQILAVGDTVYKDMLKMGWSRFFKFTRYDSRPKDMRKSNSRKTGWFTTGWSRPILTDNFVVAVQNGWYVVNSPWTIWEMAHWETHSTAAGKEKKEHSSDSTDDGIFANAMAYLGPNDLRSLTERSKKRNRGPGDVEALPDIDIAPYGNYLPTRPYEVDFERLR